MSQSAPVKKQPERVPVPEVQSYSLDGHGPQSKPTLIQRFKAQYLTREGLLGDYNWGELCMPRLLPYRKSSSTQPKSAPFFGLEDQLPVMLAVVCGLQHCLAMLAGLSECEWER